MRIVALILLVIPGIIATWGVKLIRDAVFNDIYPYFFHWAIQSLIGILLFISGLAFIGGFILHRDRKRNLAKGRFKRRNRS
ncbi:DUF2627 domain-containing protein [Aquibacillus salsiterrae]|uniref:DUF2627 domain-containing protein n=1 Tax=Aquibacillus salsiterrae TaxID=2950439 RepID=A0A9X3WDK2_9BACI|nr:DUF2627 domain-containing protein [Aquibacillus salsiterrae]MDC3415469.1 DUF2627 domain-containing protein [Aquibacillus salsiterrae]